MIEYLKQGSTGARQFGGRAALEQQRVAARVQRLQQRLVAPRRRP